MKIGAALAAVMLLLGLMFGLSVARSVSRPLAALHNNAVRVSEGKLGGFEAVRSPFEEIQQVSVTFMGVVQELKQTGTAPPACIFIAVMQFVSAKCVG